MTRAVHLPSLDGIRGLAILLVIAHNVQMLDAPQMHGAVALTQFLLNFGWIGVPLFFVLSGFLITGILLDGMGQAHGLRHFIVRRALRIFPLYYGALFLIFVLLPAIGVQPEMYRAQAPYQVWLWTYLSNWTDAMGIGPMNLPHFWTLAVEEQFYLFWPLLVYALRDKGRIAIACVLIAIAAPICRYVLFTKGYSTYIVYEWTICRVDSLAIGSLAALIWRMPQASAWVKAHALKLGLATLALVAAGFLWTHAYPRLSLHGMVEGYSILAIAFAVAIYAAAKHDGHGCQTRTPLWHRLLCLSPLQKVGKYSYGMYVIHKPLHDLFSQTALTHLGIQTSGHIFNACLHYVGLSLVTFVLAWLSYNLYEVHFLRLKRHFA